MQPQSFHGHLAHLFSSQSTLDTGGGEGNGAIVQRRSGFKGVQTMP